MHFPNVPVVLRAVFAGNLLLFACGTVLTWSSSELPKLTDPSTTPFTRQITPEESSWISSLLTLGACIGPFVSAYLLDRIGRRRALLFLSAPLVVCHPFLAFSDTPEVFYAARFLIGLSLGGAFIAVPIYIGEISDKFNRGALTSSISCFVCFGILFSCSLGPYVGITTFNLTLTLFPVLFLVVFYLCAPESPHYCVIKSEIDEAREILGKIRVGHETVEKELAEIQGSLADDVGDAFSPRATIRALIISVGLLVFQQFSGINAVLFYSQQIFQQTGTSYPAEICTIIVVGVQFIGSFFTPFVVDRSGRKMILFWSAMGMAASEVPLGVYCYLRSNGINVAPVSFLPILSLTSFIVCFNLGFGPVPWILICELFPSNIKGIASASVASFVWVLALLVTKYFEVIIMSVGIGQLFLFFAFCCLAAALFVVLCVVETKGMSLVEIQNVLKA